MLLHSLTSILARREPGWRRRREGVWVAGDVAQQMNSAILSLPLGVAKFCWGHRDRELLREGSWGPNSSLLVPYLPPPVSQPAGDKTGLRAVCLGQSHKGEHN